MGSLLAMILAIPLFHYDLVTLSSIIRDPGTENISVIKFFQIIQSITLFIIPALVAAWLFSPNTFDFIAARKKPSEVTLVLVSLSIVAAIPMLNMVTDLNTRLELPQWFDGLEQKMINLEESAAKLTELFLRSDSVADLLINLFMIALLPAIGEEFLFRGVVQRLLSEWTKNNYVGIIITAFLFSFIHFQFYGFVPRFLLGLYFGYLMFWSGSIWVPVIAHFVNNGLAVFYYHFAAKPMGDTPLDTVGTPGNGNYILYISVFLTSLIIGMIYLKEKSNKAVTPL
jgi:membrane protease YdiL (CAAX protease family)